MMRSMWATSLPSPTSASPTIVLVIFAIATLPFLGLVEGSSSRSGKARSSGASYAPARRVFKTNPML
jgi:hypothetical protein